MFNIPEDALEWVFPGWSWPGAERPLNNHRLTAAVRVFVRDHLRSLEQLELLLLLLEDETRWWSAEAAARELWTSAGAAAARLEELSKRNLLGVRISDQLYFRYAPVSPTLDAAVRETARAYKEKPVAVAAAIHSQPVDEIRAFADAFRLRKEEGSDA